MDQLEPLMGPVPIRVFKTPPVPTNYWTQEDWARYIENFPVLPPPPQEIYALGEVWRFFCLTDEGPIYERQTAEDYSCSDGGVRAGEEKEGGDQGGHLGPD